MNNNVKPRPLVSIVIPAFNAAEYLNEAIDSVLAQTYPNIELIVLDDGSTDSTPAILDSYDRNLFYRESHQNMGQSETLNKGWSMAKGDILSYLSADDLLKPEAVERAVESLKLHPNVVLVYGDYELIDKASRVIRTIKAPDYDQTELIANIVVQPGPGVFFRRREFDRIGGWNSEYRQTPDYEYWLRLSLCGDFLRIPETLAAFRIHDESQTYAEAPIGRAEEIIDVIASFFQRNDLPLQVERLRERAMAMSHLVATRYHWRAGRYRFVLKHLRRVAATRPDLLLSKRIVLLMRGAVFFRLKKLISHLSRDFIHL